MSSLADSYHMVPRHPHEKQDFTLYPEHSSIIATTAMDMHSLPAEAYSSYPRSAHEAALGSPLTYVDPSLYSEPNYMFNSEPSPGMYQDSHHHHHHHHHHNNNNNNNNTDMRASSSNLSTASAPSSASSAVGSPQSVPSHATAMADWNHNGFAITPNIVGQNDYFLGHEYTYHGMEAFSPIEYSSKGPGYVDPSMIHHQELSRPMMPYETYAHPNQAYPVSPALSASPQPPAIRHETRSPFVNTHYAPYNSPFPPPASDTARAPAGNFMSPPRESWESPDSKEKQRCTCPECGKVFKDLKAHMLTHQNERPEKCPIGTCEYHVKGFARKYDKNRHTLTHYKGTMVCGFCPGSGSTAEKSFNRADVFKRHLTAVHSVEQTPPNARRKQGAAGAARKLATNYPPDATGKCSTCSHTFANAQEFYEHLDDCVLRIVQQEDPSEAINAKRLAEVENDRNVAQTLEKNNLPTTTPTAATETASATTASTTTTTAATQSASANGDEDDDAEMSEVDDEHETASPTTAKSLSKPSSPRRKSNPANGVQKARGMTHSRGGVPVATKKGGRKNRRDYPSSWGFDKGQVSMKKRVMTVFDGTHRLVKDDMMLSTDNEVRIQLSDGKSYVTDLDVLTMRRAEAFHNADEEEKASWVANDPTKEQMKRAQQLMAGNISPALTARTA